MLTPTVPPLRATLTDPAVAVGVPPQVLVKPLGVATTKFAGKLSVNATPCAASGLVAGLVIVMVMVLTPFGWMPAGLNPLAIVTGPSTFTEAVLLVTPVPPSVEVTLLVVLFLVPAVVPFTVSEKVQDPLAASVPPESVTLEGGPITGVIVPPPQDPVTVVEVNCNPAGRLSVKPIPVKPTVVLGLLTWKLIVVVATFKATLRSANDFTTVGGATTVRLSLAAVPDPPSVEFTVTELFFTPPVVP